MATDQLLNTAEAAAVLNVRPHTLNCWRSSGKGPTYRKIGGCCRYSRADLDQFIQKAARRSTSDPGAAR